MVAFGAGRGSKSGVLLAGAIAALAWTATASPQPAAAADSVTVHVDQAAIVKLPERTATLVIGNPLIADAVVQPGGIAVITAKSYGATNLIALDGSGTSLMQQTVQVLGPSDRVVVVYRGTARESYSCVPNCERRITVGDTPAFFNANIGQIGAIRTQNAAQQQQR